MRIVCDGLDLSDALLKVSRGTNSRTTTPILEGIKLSADEEQLTLSATDLELSIEKTIRADVKMEGEIVVPGKLFNEYIKKLNDEQIELTSDERNMLTIKYADSMGKIQCFDANDYPRTKELDYAESFILAERDLKALINKSIFAVASDDSRPILKGVKIEVNDGEVTAVALDGYRIAVVRKKVNRATASLSVIVPARSLGEIAKLLGDSDNPIQVFIQKNHLMVSVDNTKITTRLLDGDFVNYKQIIPNLFTTTVILNRAQLADALERASLLARSERNNLVRFDMTDKLMVLSSRSEVGDVKENITIALKGNDLSIAFNARYFNEALRNLNDEFLRLEFKSNIAPCIITPNEGEEYLFLIAPVRIN